MGIFYSQTDIAGPGNVSQILSSPDVPAKAPKNSDGLPAYCKDAAVLAIPRTDDKTIADIDSVIDLTDAIDPDGRLVWNAPAGEWTVLRFICACTGESLYLPSPNSKGLIIDHFNPDATEMHFQHLIDCLENELGDLRESALEFLYLPSYEVTSYEKEKGMIWTPRLREEFQVRRGYDPAKYLPLLFGYTIPDKKISDRFQFDFNLTLSDLIVECHYAKAREICNKYGLKLCSEAGGPGQPLHNCPFEALSALGALDVLRGEFWYEHQILDENGIDILWLVKEIACASHIYGKGIVDGEAFTSWHHWQLPMSGLKPLADRAMCGGLNLFTFHTGAHSPPEAGMPGWAYHAGTHINPNRAWWPKSKPFMEYIARCCFLLQQGHFVGDVCYYYGDEAPNFVKPKHIDPSLGYGYDYDVTNSDVIVNRMCVENGRIVLPDGMRYEILVLPEREDMNVHVLAKLMSLVEAGAVIVGPKPSRSNGLANYKRRDTRVRELADELWGDCDGKQIKENIYGKGKVIWGRPLREILIERGMNPDFMFSSNSGDDVLDYIHRRTSTEDIYFISNKTAEWVEANCTFRIANRTPEFWRPDSGEICPAIPFTQGKGVTCLPLRLPPNGSVFVVLRNDAPRQYITSASGDDASCEVIDMNDGGIELRVREMGSYTFKTNLGKSWKIDVDSIPMPIEIIGPWDIHFPRGWGAPPVSTFPELISWTSSKDEGVKYFSGIAEYRKEFQIAPELQMENMYFTLDLGAVRDVADVYLNGRHLGILWKEPFCMDVTNVLKLGTNRLSVEIGNQWSNRIVGDTKLPKGEGYTSTNIQWSIMWKRKWEDTPLQESGLLGPVRIIPAVRIRKELPD